MSLLLAMLYKDQNNGGYWFSYEVQKGTIKIYQYIIEHFQIINICKLGKTYSGNINMAQQNHPKQLNQVHSK